MYFEKTKNRPMVIMLIAVMIISAVLPYVTDTAAAFSGKKGSTYTTYDSGKIVYGSGDGGYSNTRKTDLDDGIGSRYAYCVQPSKLSPVVGKMTVDKVVTDENETGKWNALRNIVYYSPSYPGYENNVKSIKSASYYTGNFTHDWAVAHLAMSYVYEKRPSDLATFGGTKASDLGELWTSAKKMGDALWKSDSTKDEAVPESFMVFISYQEKAQDVIVGYMESPGYLKMKKKSSLTKISDDNSMYDFSGAVYTVYDKEGNSKGTLTTDSDGNSGKIELDEGTYTVKETTAPAGFAKDTETYTVNVESEETTTFTASETPITAKIDLLIQKKTDGYKHDHAEGDASLKGAVYKVEYYDSSSAPEEKAVKVKATPKATWYFTTDENGKVDRTNPKTSDGYDSSALFKDADKNVVFPLGSYVVTEVKEPKGYLLDNTPEIIHVTEDGTDKAYTKSYDTAESVEEIMKGGVKAAKIDHVRAANVPQGDATLEGAEFSIINRSAYSVVVNGKEYGTDKTVLTITTDSKGIASSEKKVLPYGTYTIRETKAPAGYLLNDSWEETFSIRSDGQMIDLTGKPVDEDIKLGGIRIFKKDNDLREARPQGDAELKGAEFRVINKSKASVTVNGIEYIPEDIVMTIVTGEDGTAKTGQILPYGTYFVEEIKAPAGYLINGSWKATVEVREDKKTVELTEDPVAESVMRGGVKVSKIDHDKAKNVPQGDAVLSGAEFTITNASSHPVVVNGKEYQTGDAVLVINSDENGFAATDEKALPFGTYTIRETKAPVGYLLNESWEETFSIRSDGQMIDFTGKKVDDDVQRGGISIYKIDSGLETAEAQGDATLAGAEFTVTNKSIESVIVNDTEYQPGDIVMTITTDASGMAETGNILPYGTYSLKEKSPSEGYLLNKTWEAAVEVRSHNTTIGLMNKAVKEDVERGGVIVQKIDNDIDEAYAQGDATLAGAEFTITNKSKGRVVVDGNTFAPGEDVLVITTDATGHAESAKDALPYGTYSIRETKPSPGYLLNTEWEKTFEIREDGQIVDLAEEPVREAVERSGIQIVKRDKELGTSEALGGATLNGIVMTIKNVSGHDVIVRKDIDNVTDIIDWKKPVMKKDLFESGEIKRVPTGEDVGTITVHWNKEKKAYTAETLPDDLPYGTYTIRESKTNDSYQRTDKTEHKFEVREDGKVYSYDEFSDIFTFDDYVYRSDVQGTKIADSTSERFSLVPFKIISVTNGETHVVVTDKNGYFTTKDRRTQDELEESEGTDTARVINPFDDLMAAEAITNTMIEERYSDIRMGVWFGTGDKGSIASSDSSVGALPYDTYILEEMSCERNEGYTLQKFLFTVDEKSRNGFVDLETITDDCPEIGTAASVDGKNTDVRVSSDITLTDTVEYSGLKRGETYTVKGRLIDKATGDIVKDAKGNEVTSETTFRAGRTNGKVKVKFSFDGSNMYDMTTVVFESVYDAGGHIVARHEDIDDEFQTITWEKLEPGYEMYKVRTTKAPKKGDKFGFHATDTVEYDVYVENTGNITLTMDVTDQFTDDPEYFTEPVIKDIRFSGNGMRNNEDEHMANITLAPHEKAVVTFTAMVKDEAMEYLAGAAMDSDSEDKNGKGTNLTYQFNVTDDKDGYVNTAKCENVIYPDPRNPEEPKQLDPKEDISQTPVQKPAIGTTLTDEFGKKEIIVSEKTTLVDTVAYNGLDTAKWYVVEGTLIVKDTGDPLIENGKEITVTSDPFKPGRANGFTEIIFEIDTTGLEGKELVAFEDLYRLDGFSKGDDVTRAEKVLVADHKDINDEGQTVKLVKQDEPDTPVTPDEPKTPDKSDEPASVKTVHPKTGDTTNILFPALLLISSAAGLTAVARRRKKH